MLELLYIEINGFCVVMLLIMLINLRRSPTMLVDERLFRLLLLLVIGALVTDTAGWLLDGATFPGARSLLVLSDTANFTISAAVDLVWLLYADAKIYGDLHALRRRARVYFIPFAVTALLALLSPVTGWVFTIGENNVYMRGAAAPLYIALTWLMLFYPVPFALYRTAHEKLDYKRVEYLLVCSFAVLPLIGGAIQGFFYGLPLLWPTAALSTLFIFINLQNRQISIDGLTGINNRRTLNRYLDGRYQDLRPGDLMYLMLLDIDSFKSINDTYGHAVGDAALIEMAEALKVVCGRSGAFLARYGGDEFAVVSLSGRHKSPEHIIGELREELERRGDGCRPYTLNVSAGWAALGFGEGGVDKLINDADAEMYKNKRER